MSDCNHDALLGPYLDGELPDARRQEVEAHLRECPACAREMQQLRSLSQRLRAASTPTLTAPDKADLRRRALLAATEAPGVRWVRWISSAAAVVFIVCMSQVVISHLTPHPGAPRGIPVETRPATPDPRERALQIHQAVEQSAPQPTTDRAK